MDRAVAAADSNRGRASQDRSAFNTLAAIQEQPQPFYKSSNNDRTYRIFPANSSILTLRKDLRRLLTQGCYECDLQNSQFLIAGWRWKIPELVEFALSGKSLWDELTSYLGVPCDSTTVDVLKRELVYPLLFGRSPYWARHEINRSLKLNCQFDIGAMLLRHDLIRKAIAGRKRRVAWLRSQGSFRTFLGRKFETEGASAGTINSVLAHDVQDIELYLMEPLIHLDKDEDSFDIILHQHDGMTVRLHHPQRVRQHQERIAKAIEERAKKLGFAAKITWMKC